MTFIRLSTRRLSTRCLVRDNLAMHSSVVRLLDYARRTTRGSARPIEDFAALQKALDVSSASMTNWKSRGVSKEGAIQAEAVLGSSVGWLLTGEGAENARPIKLNTEAGPDIRGLVPLISWIQAGNWNPAADPLLPGEAERWLPCIVPHSSDTYVLRVKGDSMTAPHGNTRTYPEGSLVFVDPAKRSPVNGDRIIARLSGSDEVTFKVYKAEDGRQWLHPLNPAHDSIREEFSVLGTILGKWEDG